MNKQELLQRYTTMALIRNCEEVLAQYFLDNRIMSFIHFYVGQEAVATGVCAELTHADRVFGNHRSHGHYLAKGGCPNAMMAEILGKFTGCCKGYGGSMHMIDKSVNFLGSTPILGSVAPIAAGSAFQQKQNGSGDVTCAFIGDGASEEGVVYETVNLAALMNLPYLLVIENNLYSVQTKLSARRSPRHYSKKIYEGLGAHYIRCDGNSIESVSQATRAALNFIKKHNVPTVLECDTFRHMAHSAPLFDDKLNYREDDTLDKRKACDPLKFVEDIYLTKGYPLELLVDANENTLNIAKAALQFAIDSPEPATTNLTKNIYA